MKWTASRVAACLLLGQAAAYALGWGIGAVIATADRALSRIDWTPGPDA